MHVLLSRSHIRGHVRAKPTYLSAERFSWIYFQSQRAGAVWVELRWALSYDLLFSSSHLAFCFPLMWILSCYTSSEVFHPFSSSSHLKPYLCFQHYETHSFWSPAEAPDQTGSQILLFPPANCLMFCLLKSFPTWSCQGGNMYAFYIWFSEKKVRGQDHSRTVYSWNRTMKIIWS